MAFHSKNPRFETMNLTDQAAGSVTNPPSGVYKLLLRSGLFKLLNSAGTEISLNPMTTAGDIQYGGASGAPTRLAAGTNSQILIGGASAPSWGSITNAMIDAAAAIAGSKLVAATGAVAGAVTTAAQTFAGVKTFTNGLILGSGSTLAEYVAPTTFTVSGFTGATLSSEVMAVYAIVGKIMTIWIEFNVTIGGSPVGDFSFTIPASKTARDNASAATYLGSSVQIDGQAALGMAHITDNGTTISIRKDGASGNFLASTAYYIRGTFIFPIA